MMRMGKSFVTSGLKAMVCNYKRWPRVTEVDRDQDIIDQVEDIGSAYRLPRYFLNEFS